MQDFGVSIEYFIGSVLNPVTWIIVAVTLYLTRGWLRVMRVAASVAATVALSALFDMAGRYVPMVNAVAGLVFPALVALGISSTWVLIRRSATFEEICPDDGDEGD